MGRLLVVTDHRFYRRDGRIVDTYCFDRAFFDDYRSVFSEVVVAARVRRDVPPPSARPADGDGVRFVELPDLRWARWVLSTWMHMPALQQAVSAADAICLRIPSGSSRVAFRYVMLAGKPVMFELIGDPRESLRNLGIVADVFSRLNARLVRKIVQAAVAGSYVSASHLQRAYPASSSTMTDSISSIRLPESDLELPKQYAAQHGELRVVHVGSMVPVKDHRTLVEGVARAASGGMAIRLSLVGDGPVRNELEALAEQLGIRDRVDFHGHVSDRDRLKEILRESDLFVMSSVSEGMPRAMIEAMAVGLPAIGSAVGGIAELLKVDQLFPAGDAAALADRLRAVSSPARLSEFAVRSADTARTFIQPVLSERRRRLLGHLKSVAERRP